MRGNLISARDHFFNALIANISAVKIEAAPGSHPVSVWEGKTVIKPIQFFIFEIFVGLWMLLCSFCFKKPKHISCELEDFFSILLIKETLVKNEWSI